MAAGAIDNEETTFLQVRFLIGMLSILAVMDTALKILRETFGYTEFRGFQEEVIEHVRGGEHALVLMPTGGGKSLCHTGFPYQFFHGQAFEHLPTTEH